MSWVKIYAGYAEIKETDLTEYPKEDSFKCADTALEHLITQIPPDDIQRIRLLLLYSSISFNDRIKTNRSKKKKDPKYKLTNNPTTMKDEKDSHNELIRHLYDRLVRMIIDRTCKKKYSKQTGIVGPLSDYPIPFRLSSSTVEEAEKTKLSRNRREGTISIPEGITVNIPQVIGTRTAGEYIKPRNSIEVDIQDNSMVLCAVCSDNIPISVVKESFKAKNFKDDMINPEKLRESAARICNRLFGGLYNQCNRYPEEYIDRASLKETPKLLLMYSGGARKYKETEVTESNKSEWRSGIERSFLESLLNEAHRRNENIWIVGGVSGHGETGDYPFQFFIRKNEIIKDSLKIKGRHVKGWPRIKIPKQLDNWLRNYYIDNIEELLGTDDNVEEDSVVAALIPMIGPSNSGSISTLSEKNISKYIDNLIPIVDPERGIKLVTFLREKEMKDGTPSSETNGLKRIITNDSEITRKEFESISPILLYEGISKYDGERKTLFDSIKMRLRASETIRDSEYITRVIKEEISTREKGLKEWLEMWNAKAKINYDKGQFTFSTEDVKNGNEKVNSIQDSSNINPSFNNYLGIPLNPNGHYIFYERGSKKSIYPFFPIGFYQDPRNRINDWSPTNLPKIDDLAFSFTVPYPFTKQYVYFGEIKPDFKDYSIFVTA